MERIHEFFVVTKTSVYRVSDEKDEHGWPIVEKIALAGESKIGIGERLEGGYLVGVTRWGGIILYNEDHPRKERRQTAAMVNTFFHGGKTSPIAALFLNKEEAAECLKAENRQKFDARWEEQTKNVLESIGNDHQVFIVDHHDVIYDD